MDASQAKGTPEQASGDGGGMPGFELAELLRRSFPELDVARFDAGLADSEAELSRCKVWTAFSAQFNEWVRDGRVAPIQRALNLVDRLLRGAAVLPERGLEVGDDVRSSLVACFLENVVDSSATWAAHGRPYLGSAVQSFLQEDEPWWLRDQA